MEALIWRRRQGELDVCLPFPFQVKPLCLTLTKVHHQCMCQVQPLHWTVSLINVGVVSSSWHSDNNMGKTGDTQGKNVCTQEHVLGLSAGLRGCSGIMCGSTSCPHNGLWLCCLASDLWLEPSLRCLISDRLDWSAQGERDIQLLSCCKQS